MTKFYEKHFKYFDIWVAIILTIVYINYAPWFFKIPTDYNILDIASIYIWLSWFLLSIFAIIFSFKDGERVSRLQKSPYYKDVFYVFQNAIIVTAFFWLAFILISIYDNNFKRQICQYVFTLKELIISSLIFIIVLSSRCLWIVKKIFLLSIT